MTRPELEPRLSLLDARVAVSVSESSDLARLGLGPQHCDAAVAEVVRGVLLAGGRVLYGGRLKPPGFTQIMMKEADSYAAPARSLTLYVPYPEWASIPRTELDELGRGLRESVELMLLDRDGATIELDAACEFPLVEKTAMPGALTAMRERIAADATAAVLIGGKLERRAPSISKNLEVESARDPLSEYWVPGVIEEARTMLDRRVPLFCAGGFGGAAAAVAKTLAGRELPWAPPNFPAGVASDPAAKELRSLRQSRPGPVKNGLTSDEQQRLESSHRPGEIAALVVLGLSRIHEPGARGHATR